MIEFSDTTIRESKGSYEKTKQLMAPEGSKINWMLRTDAVVVTDAIVARYLIHLWRDTRAVIMDMDRPPEIQLPDDDLNALHDWTEDNGWKLCVHKDLLDDPVAFTFWLRLFRAGVVFSEVLQEHEEEEIERFNKSFARLQKEED